jgi:SpoVK/Ycf46/Vps4 family AAA+-type ATPase
VYSRIASELFVHFTTLQDALDSELLQPGRFGMQILLEEPDREAREQLLTKHLKPMKIVTADAEVRAHDARINTAIVRCSAQHLWLSASLCIILDTGLQSNCNSIQRLRSSTCCVDY